METQLSKTGSSPLLDGWGCRWTSHSPRHPRPWTMERVLRIYQVADMLMDNAPPEDQSNQTRVTALQSLGSHGSSFPKQSFRSGISPARSGCQGSVHLTAGPRVLPNM